MIEDFFNDFFDSFIVYFGGQSSKKTEGYTWVFLVGDGVGVLGVRFRMKGVFTTTIPLSRFFILWLGVAPKFPVIFCEFRLAGC